MPKIDITNIRMNAGRVLMIILLGFFMASTHASAQENVFITTNIVPAGKGQVELDPVQPVDGYVPGTVVSVTAVDSDPCYQFSHWSGDASGSDPVISVVVNEDMTIDANFAPGIFSVTTNTLSQFVITGSPPSAKPLIITSTGGNCFSWSLTTTEPWIYISKKNGTGDDSVAVNIISSQVPCQGTHVGFIQLRSVNSDPEVINIPVRLRVGAQEVTASVTGNPTAISCQDYSPDIITVTITNNSASEIVFSSPPDFGEGFVLKNPDVFPLTLEDDSQAPLNQAELFIRFEPTEEQAGLISSQVKMEANNCGREVYFELEATRIKPTSVVDVDELDFGTINNCDIDPLPVRTIELENLYVENANLWYKKPQGFTLISAPNAVAGGSTATIEIRAEREGPAVIDSVLEIEVDYSICSEFIRVKLTGNRQSPSFYAETDSASGMFTEVEFDTTCLGSSDTKTIRVVNDGNSELNFNIVLATPDYFSADPSTFTLAAGSAQSVTLTFNPIIAGSFSSEIVISADQCDLSDTTTIFGRTFNEVLLSADVTPSTILLENCEDEGTFTLSVENTDTETASFDAPPTLPDGFEWDESVSYPVIIPAGETFTANIYFRPPGGMSGIYADTVNWFGEPCGTKATFYIEGEFILPTYTVTPTEIDLGMIVNCEGEPQTESQAFTFTNTSTIDMVVMPQEAPEGFELTYDDSAIPDSGIAVAGGEAIDITIAATAGDPGDFTETIAFDVIAGMNGICNSTFDITVSGTWYQPAFVVEVVAEGDNEWEPLCVGASEKRVFVIRNTGNIQIEVQSDGFGEGSPFRLLNVPFNLILNPDEQRNFEVSFSPDARGDVSDSLFFTETICGSTAALFVSGSGVEPNFEVTEIDPEMPLNILSCEPEDNRVITVTVANTSEDPVTLRDIFLPDGFTLDGATPFPISLDPMDTYDFVITFNGTELGNYGGTATIFAEECELEVSFDLEATVSSSSYTLSDSELNFGDIRMCPDGNVFPDDLNNLSQSIEISNSGTTPMTVNATFSLPHPNVKMTSPVSSPFDLAPGQTKYITVVLEPPFTNLTDIQASLRIVSSLDTVCSIEPTIIPITANISRVNFAFVQDSIRASADLQQDSLAIWAVIQNTGEGDITLNLGLNGSAHFALGSDPVVTLETGESDSVLVIFTPSQIGTFTSTLTATDGVCNTEDDVNITVSILQGGVVLMGNDIPGQQLTLQARPGDIVEIPVYLKESLDLNPGNYPFPLDNIVLTFDFNFNFYDLYPLSIAAESVDNADMNSTSELGLKTITLSGSSFDAGLLATIEAEVLLGTQSTTEWSFSNPEFTPLVAFVEVDNNGTGMVNLQPRNGFLTRQDLGIPWVQTPSPNPVTSTSTQTATVTYNVVEDGHVEVTLFNELGVVVRELEAGWMSKGVHSVHIKTADLPNGMYHVLYRTGSFQSSQKLILGR